MGFLAENGVTAEYFVPNHLARLKPEFSRPTKVGYFARASKPIEINPSGNFV
jgi:hypothetical protein